MAFTKEELQKAIADETAQIASLQQQAEEAFKQMSAGANNAIGRCQGKIEVWQEMLALIEKDDVGAHA